MNAPEQLTFGAIVSDTPSSVHCLCPMPPRYDLRVGSVTYRGANVLGECGLVENRARLVLWIERCRQSGQAVEILTHHLGELHQATKVSVDAALVEILP